MAAAASQCAVFSCISRVFYSLSQHLRLDAIDVGKIDASIGAKPIEEPFTLKNVLPERPNKEQMELGFDWMRKEIKEEELRMQEKTAE